jgi:hypothetical protein
MKTIHLLLAGIAISGLLAACDDLPPEDDSYQSGVFVSAFLEPGFTGTQSIYLTHMVHDGTPLNLANSYVPGAEILLVNQTSGDSVLASLNLTSFSYQFSLDSMALNPYDEVLLKLSGSWDGQTFNGEALTTIVSPASFAWTLPVPADTIMLHDATLEEGLNDPTVFYLNWEHLDDQLAYRYQLRFNSEVYDTLSGEWIDTPADRLDWLRTDEEMAWQWDTSPCLLTVPSTWTGQDMRASWGAFVFVDEANDTLIDGNQHHQGYYSVEVQRLNQDATNYHFSVHQWIRAFEWDPISFNLVGDGVNGIVASLCRHGFRVQIVDD